MPLDRKPSEEHSTSDARRQFGLVRYTQSGSLTTAVSLVRYTQSGSLTTAVRMITLSPRRRTSATFGSRAVSVIAAPLLHRKARHKTGLLTAFRQGEVYATRRTLVLTVQTQELHRR